jgi:uncharacterized protein (TIGR02680 family)
MEKQFVLNRLGLLNFWYYPNQTFDLSDGHLLLRGTNGAGKSVTMQSLMPVLLDGNTEASRLDSFGSRDRKMKDYLLGEKDVSGKDEAIGYLWTEFKIADQYLTIGIGMHGRRSADNLKRWYFVIEDNRRINLDFSLLTNETETSATPLSQKQLRNRLMSGGRVYDKPADYAKFVQKHIFGFSSAEDFEDTIKLLIQLRNPKLNKSFTPDDLENILSDSLPSLTDDNVQASAQTLNQIEQTNNNILNSKLQAKALQPLLKAQKKYRRDKLAYLSQQSAERTQTFKRWNNEYARLEKELQSIRDQQKECDEKAQNLVTQAKSLSAKRDTLRNNEGFDLVDQEKKLTDEKSSYQKQMTNKKRELDKNEANIEAYRARLDEITEQKHQLEQQLAELKSRMLTLAQKSSFEFQHQTILEQSLDFQQWKQQANEQSNHFDEAIELFRQSQRQKRDVDELDQELDNENHRMDELEKDQKDWKNQYSDELFNLKQTFVDYRQSLSFEVSQDVIGTVQTKLDDIYTEDVPDFSVAIQELTKRFVDEKSRLQIKIAQINSQLSQTAQAISDLRDQQEEIRNQQYPVPERTERRSSKRADITDAVPLYQLLEFNDNVSSDMQNAIEGALLESGVLDGLVSQSGDIVVGDETLIPDPLLMQATLQDYLHADVDQDSPITESQVENILSSIAVDDSSPDVKTIVTPDGKFKVGIISGQSDPEYAALFIGATAQKRYREQKIAEIELEIEGLQTNIQTYEDELHKTERQSQLVSDDQKRMPSDKDLNQLNYQLKQISDRIDQQLKTIERVTTKLNQAQSKMQRTTLKINQVTSKDKMEKTAEAYQFAKKAINDYIDAIGELSNISNNINNQAQRYSDTKVSIDQQTEGLKNITEDIQTLNQRITRLTASINSVIEKQKLAGDLNKIRQSLVETEDQIQQNGRDQDENRKLMTTIAGKLATTQQDLNNATDKLQFEEPFSKLINETFDQELAREIDQNNELDLEQLKLELAQANTVTTDVLQNDSKQLSQKFTTQSDQLREYNPKLNSRTTLKIPEWISALKDHQSQVDVWKMNLNTHVEATVELRGSDESVNKLDTELTQQIEINKEAMSQNEEELFRVIIFDSLGNIIRNRINKARDWVDKTNSVLQRQENNSNLKLSIKWTIKPSDDISDADNKKGVELLLKDPNSLNDADLKQIKNFLNSKIQNRRDEYDDADKTIQMTTILREALDYRQWFQFRLFYTQVGNTKKQLTRAVFNKFSGGEKAITMYTPLFVAMSARYDNAADSAPKIITLDEAFAGIDESNISQLFKTIHQLNFNYIMNSQQLQAEYETVPSLNTYLLLRPKGKNGNVVTTIKTHWNGKTKEEQV